jgi:hypothetical protein
MVKFVEHRIGDTRVVRLTCLNLAVSHGGVEGRKAPAVLEHPVVQVDLAAGPDPDGDVADESAVGVEDLVGSIDERGDLTQDRVGAPSQALEVLPTLDRDDLAQTLAVVLVPSWRTP